MLYAYNGDTKAVIENCDILTTQGLNKMTYTIDQLVDFAKNEMSEFALATEEQLDKVIDIFNDQGLAGDDLATWWDEMNESSYWEYM